MFGDSINFSPKQFHPRIQFVQRIAIQAFAGKKAGRPEAGRSLSGSVFIVH